MPRSPAGLALALVMALPVQASDLTLLMIRQPGCGYCRQWDREVGEVYQKTGEGRAAPLREVDLHDPLPGDVTVARPAQFTPTFVLLADGVESGRIEGYPGEAFFWGLLDRLIAETSHE